MESVFMLEQLDQRANERISGPAWDELRPIITAVHSALVSPSSTASGELTTIYVKYTNAAAGANPYAVMWIKKSSSLVLGLALPATHSSPLFMAAPTGCKYAGLTKYLTFTTGDIIPPDLSSWVEAAYRSCYSDSRPTPD
jgi:hypothetical protein